MAFTEWRLEHCLLLVVGLVSKNDPPHDLPNEQMWRLRNDHAQMSHAVGENDVLGNARRLDIQGEADAKMYLVF